MDVTIRVVEAMAEYRAVEALQRRAWRMADDLEVVPLHLLVAVQRSGGQLLGAFDGDEMVGFVFGFPGLAADGRVKHCSHMMGVAPAYQGAGVGYRLKLAQREHVLAQGLDLVTWTYDPLEGRNAYLNLHKLGAVCRTYVRDYYGPMDDGLNRGLPTDRLQVAWWLKAPPPVPPVPQGGGQLSPRKQSAAGGIEGGLAEASAHTAHRTARGLLAPGKLRLEAGGPRVSVEIPADYQAIKAADPALALEWRLATRAAFEAYFAAGYTAVDFVSRWVEGERHSFYLLCRG